MIINVIVEREVINVERVLTAIPSSTLGNKSRDLAKVENDCSS